MALCSHNGVTDALISDNIIYTEMATYPDYLFWIDNLPSGSILDIHDNDLSGSKDVGILYTTGNNANSKIYFHNNIGYITEHYGSATVYNTNTTVTITHGLTTTPTSISITPTWDASAYVSGADATLFNVTFTDPTATKTLYWEAYYQP